MLVLFACGVCCSYIPFSILYFFSYLARSYLFHVYSDGRWQHDGVPAASSNITFNYSYTMIMHSTVAWIFNYPILYTSKSHVIRKDMHVSKCIFNLNNPIYRLACSGTGLFNFPVSSANRTFPIAHSSIPVCVFYKRSAFRIGSLIRKGRVTYLNSPRPHMRNKKDIRIRDKARVDLGLFFKDI